MIWLRWAYLLVCALALFILSTFVLPAQNWDMLAYIASAYSYLGFTGQALLDRTLADLAATVPDSQFEYMTTDPFREVVTSDPESLSQLLPFYTIRPIYVGLVIAVSSLTATIGQATVVVSALGGVAILLLSGAVLIRSHPYVFYSAPVVLFLFDLFMVSRTSTPDGIAAAIAIGAIVISFKRPVLSAAALPLLPLVRTDFLILVPTMLWALYHRIPRIFAAIVFFLAICIYLGVNVAAENYGHFTIFNYQLIHGPMPYPASIPISQDIADYITAYFEGALRLVESREAWVILIALTFVALRPNFLGDHEARLLIAGVAFMALHFLAFPAAFSRTYFVTTWLAVIVILGEISRRLSAPEA